MYQKENKDNNSEKSHTLKVKVLKENQKIKNIVKVKRKVSKRSKVQTIVYKHLKKRKILFLWSNCIWKNAVV